MAWTDRIQTAAYISPSGTRFEFEYENVSIESDKKTGTFIFPELNGQYIQDLGRSGRRFPFNIFFSGSEYDIDSNSFFQALEEKGIGTLEHPLYGVRKVIPTGTIQRRDDLVTAANQAIFTITFSETIVNINFPSSDLNDKTDIQNSVSELGDDLSEQYTNNMNLDDAGDAVNAQNDLLDKKDALTQILENLSSINEDIENSMNTISNSLDNDVVNMIINPGGIADQIITLVNTPSNIVTNIETMIEGYGSVIDMILPNIGMIEANENDYHNSNLILCASLGAIALSCLNAEFFNRPQAIETADKIIDIFDNISEYIDNQIIGLEINDTGEMYTTLQDVYSKTLGYLVRLSFDLPKKIYLTLTEDRQIIELVSELYGDLNMIDFFIQTNDLTTDEIEILPLGMEVIYFE